MSKASAKLNELVNEFRAISSGRNNLLDAILPPLGFVALNALWGLRAALVGSLALGLGLAGLRLVRRQSLGYVAGGLAVTGISLLTALLSGRAEDYFLAQIASTALTIVGCLGSVLLGRPLVAFTSHLARGWPLRWYWQARVRPAYSEVTLAWAALFALKMLSQYLIYRQGRTAALGLFNALTGWPATVLVLAGSYLYGLWRLKRLRGPSVAEFERGAPPPWEGQQRGF